MNECTNCAGEGGWFEGFNEEREWVLCNDCNGSGTIIDDED